MSYILDALKKSEAERQQQHAAGIADIPLRRGRAGTPAWVWLLGGLLLINVAALAFLLLKPAAESTLGAGTLPAAPASAGVTGASAGAGAVVPRTGTGTAPPVDNTPPAAGAQTTPSPVAPAAQPPAATPLAETGSGAAATAGDGATTPPAANSATDGATTPPAADSTTESTLMELRASGTLQLPDLHLDIHVFSENQAERFVFVNMRKYREQERLQEGPVVREITPNGVVLEHRNYRFLLPRE